MFAISVERIISKPIAQVFAILTDHANYQQFRAVDQSRLLQKGEEAPNGLGAVREIMASGAVLHEEIVAYEPPVLMGYKIIYSKPLPYDHQFGELRLQSVGDKTHVRWQSRGRIKVPLLGPLWFDRKVQSVGQRAFGSILKHIDLMP